MFVINLAHSLSGMVVVWDFKQLMFVQVYMRPNTVEALTMNNRYFFNVLLESFVKGEAQHNKLNNRFAC